MRVDSIELRVFVEGVLMPPRAIGKVSVIERRGREISGTISFPAIPGFRSEDLARARIYVFWSNEKIRSERATNDWPILCSGEISGDAFRKSPANRYLEYAWIGEHVYWDQCRLYFYNLSSSTNAQGGDANRVLYEKQRALFFGNDKVTLDIGAAGASLQNRIVTEIKGLGSKSMPAMVRSMYKATMTSNFFFDEANKQLKLDQRFAVPVDDSVSSLFADQELFFSQIEHQITAKAGEVRMSQILTETLGLFRYQMLANAQPRFTSGSEKFRVRVNAEREALRTKQDELVKARLGQTVDELGLTSKTSDGEIETIAEKVIGDIENIMNLDPSTLTDDEFEKINAATVATAEEGAAIFAELNAARQAEQVAFLIAVRDELARIENPVPDVDQGTLLPELNGEAKDTLAQFLLVPETDFAAVPKCNVIFPTDAMAYGMSRDYVNEPTRSQTTVPAILNGPDEVFFAPESLKDAVRPQVTRPVLGASGSTFPPVLLADIEKAITSRFGKRVLPDSQKDANGVAIAKGHGAIDIGVPVGTPVYAFADGEVTFSGDTFESAGNYIVIKHKDLGVVTKYMHLSQRAVDKGASVKAGEQIALSGNTGRVFPKPTPANPNAGAHLHFQMHDLASNKLIDPEQFVIDADATRKGASVGLGESDQEPVVIEESTLAGDAAAARTSFADYQYLTPEERVRGIVPIYDYSMDRATAVFEHSSDLEVRRAYFGQVTLSNFLKAKYASRSFDAVPVPFNPGIACGFPGLIVDPVRSVIGVFDGVSHVLNFDGGVSATTTVSVAMPRFWDEGDPYYWVDGEEVFQPGKKVPDPEKGKFPAYYLSSLVPTNSYEESPLDPKNKEPFGGQVKARPVDELYRSLLGVQSIPYFYDSDVSPVTGAARSFNAAVDGYTVDGERSRKTIVGYYYGLKLQSEQLARQFIADYTRRDGASEQDIMVTFLGAAAGAAGYVGGPFGQGGRAAIRSVALALATAINENREHLG